MDCLSNGSRPLICTFILPVNGVISNFSKTPKSSPNPLIVSSVHRWTGIPWTLIQKGMREGKDGAAAGSQRWRIIIHFAKWKGRFSRTACMSASLANWNWNSPFPRSAPIGLPNPFHCSVKCGMRDQTFCTDLLVTRPMRVRACLWASAAGSGAWILILLCAGLVDFP